MTDYHIPVMINECIDSLAIKPNGTYIDATLGGGGHSLSILKELKDGRLYAFDCDSDAAENVSNDSRFVFIQNNFKYLQHCLRYLGCTSVDGILADLGVSSHQFNCGERGFSFRFDADLDMRMNRNAYLTAAQVINNYSAEELERIFSQYGELEQSHLAATLIIKGRAMKEIKSTRDLELVLLPISPRLHPHKFWATLYQSLRIEVNGEMEALEALLEQSLRLLKSGGRLVIITYHSLEDRMVKSFMRSGNIKGNISKDFYGNKETPFTPVTKKVITPSQEEVLLNNRSRSAKLRAVEKK